MQQKLCLWLCLLVLLAALGAGNPFLSPGSTPGDVGTASPPRAVPVSEALPPGGRSLAPFALDARSTLPGGVVPALHQVEAGKAVVPASPRAGHEACPDPVLAPLVLRVERDVAGGTVWVLGDGRRFVRNARAAVPVLVQVEDAGPLK